MQTFEQRTNRSNLYLLSDLPAAIEIRDGKPAKLVLNQANADSSCMRCVNPPCISAPPLSAEDLDISFSADHSRALCPVKAIHWDKSTEYPEIDESTCIGCGLCAAMCPIGAIHSSQDRTHFIVAKQQNNYLEQKPSTLHNKEMQILQLKELASIAKSGCYLMESDTIIKKLHKRLGLIDAANQNQFIRNILISLGCDTYIRRTGDNSYRMDGIISFTKGKTSGPLEVEFGDDCLGAIRLILDDIAVLHARYDVEKNNQTPLVIFHHMPNLRQGYWQVCVDIRQVTNIRVRTLTIIALILLMWNNKKLSESFDSYFFESRRQIDLLPLLTQAMGREINAGASVSSAFRPVK